MIELNGYLLSSGRVLSVTYADCKSRRLRKKLEENFSSDQSDLNNSFEDKGYYLNKENMPPVVRVEHDKTNISLESLQLDQDLIEQKNNLMNLNLEENRNRSVSTSSETSFDSILFDWSERWNRKLCSEYRLF